MKTTFAFFFVLCCVTDLLTMDNLNVIGDKMRAIIVDKNIHGDEKIKALEQIFKENANLKINNIRVPSCYPQGGIIPLLHIVVENYDHGPALIEYLITKGIDLYITDENKETALHRAIDINCLMIAHKLIEHMTNLDIPDRGGDTALHCAVIKRSIFIIPLLIEKGANMDARNKSRQTPFDIADDAPWKTENIKMIINYFMNVKKYLEKGIKTENMCNNHGYYISSVNYDAFDRFSAVIQWKAKIAQDKPEQHLKDNVFKQLISSRTKSVRDISFSF